VILTAEEYDSNVAELTLLIAGFESPLQIVAVAMLMLPPSAKSTTPIVVETVSLQPVALVITTTTEEVRVIPVVVKLLLEPSWTTAPPI
jgi:hypothetical protein